MTFFERYEKLCAAQTPPLDPCSRQTAQAIGVDKSTASKWKANGTTPNGEIVRAIADLLNTTADFLLSRTDDPTDYTKSHNTPNLTGKQKRFLQIFDGLQEALQSDVLEYMDFLTAKQANRQEGTTVSA